SCCSARTRRCGGSGWWCWGLAWRRGGSCARAERRSNRLGGTGAQRAPVLFLGYWSRGSAPVDAAADHAGHLAAGPDLALGIDVHVQARVVTDLAALADAVAAVAAGQGVAPGQPGGEGCVGRARGGVLEHAGAPDEGARGDLVVAAMAAGEGEHAHAFGRSGKSGDRFPVRSRVAQAGLVAG